MPPIFLHIESFLLRHAVTSSLISSSSVSCSYLLALSGGPDSLCLFYALLFFRERQGIPFHIAHVDHRWRDESRLEAEILQSLALKHQVPFHLKVLDTHQLIGNLEAACRKERYAFFLELCQKFFFQGVLTGHHLDDQSETIFKRMLEGAHWSKWNALRSESWMGQMRLLRPLLEIKKEDLKKLLIELSIQSFDDPTNRDVRFMRARLRESLFPDLEKIFGKRVQSSLISIGKDAEELVEYFDSRFISLLSQSICGPWGTFLDLHPWLPLHLVEIKYILRMLCQRVHFFLSREILAQAALALQLGKANQLFVMGKQCVWIDRHRIFVTHRNENVEEHVFPLSLGNHRLSEWEIDVSEVVCSPDRQHTSWKEGWKGGMSCCLPIGDYRIAFNTGKGNGKLRLNNLPLIKKRWNQSKVPAFLYSFFPLILSGNEIHHEFLSGRSMRTLKSGEPCWKIRVLVQR